MKSLSALLFCLFFFACGTPKPSPILSKYLRFSGGEEKWNQITSLKETGQYDYGGIQFPFSSFAKAPDHYKFIVPLDGKFFAQAFDGTKGWKIDAFKNETAPTLLGPAEAREMLNEADVDLRAPLIVSIRSGCKELNDTTVTLTSPDSASMVIVAKKVEVPDTNTSVGYYYFDAETGRLVLKKARSKNPELHGAWLTAWYSDYRKIDGITIPFLIRYETNGQMVLTVKVEKVTVNEPIAESEFQP